MRIPSFSILSFTLSTFYFTLSTFYFTLSALYFIRKLISFAVPLSTFYFTLKSQISLSVWQNIIHASFENIGYLIDFEE